MRYLILLALSAAAAYAQLFSSPTIVKGNPPTGIGGACISTPRIGYLDASGNLITCPSATHIWTVITGGVAALSESGGILTSSEPFHAPSLSLGSAPPSVTGGSGFFFGELAAPSAGFPVAGVDGCYADSTAHKLLCSNNNDTAIAVTRTVASGATAMATGAISANTCASTTTVSATGVVSTDVIDATANADVSAAVGYGAGAAAGLKVYWFPTSGNVNFVICNGTGTSITAPAMTLNWSVRR